MSDEPRCPLHDLYRSLLFFYGNTDELIVISCGALYGFSHHALNLIIFATLPAIASGNM